MSVKDFGKHNPFILALAIIGVFAVIYVGWTLYQRETAEEQRRAFFSATPAPGIPDLSKPEPLPPQP
jgi:hypothetical protein